ncbi:MAG: hypothetical protein HWN80_17740 [Candidatus Lokiarchaeota archaeon]|nr:hypothetical protein [Candidatus Lokiarchaeota archaeon]
MSLKRNKFLQLFRTINTQNIKYRGPLILRMYGLMNELELSNENRYILCNFIDQNSERFNLRKDIYDINNEVSLNQLFLFAYNKARTNNLIPKLYSEYVNTVNALSHKIDTHVNLS